MFSTEFLILALQCVDTVLIVEPDPYGIFGADADTDTGRKEKPISDILTNIQGFTLR